MPKIKKIQAYEILASGGMPSVETKIVLEDGTQAVASVSYGASAGSKEAFVLLDEDPKRYGGNGMLKAVSMVNTVLAPLLEGREVLDLPALDQIMIQADGTVNKSNFGANAILSVSMAAARAAAISQKLELYEFLAKTYDLQAQKFTLPKPLVVLIEGGKHADNSTDLQEYALAVTKDQTAVENVRMAEEVYQELKKILKQKNFSTNVGNEGAFAPAGITSNELPLKLITEAILQAGYEPKIEAGIYIDPASSEFYKDGRYHLSVDSKAVTSEEMINIYLDWFEKYPLVVCEDPLSEFDWENWPKITKLAKIPIVADDLTVTNTKLWQKAIDLKAANAILIKLNQAGTVSETIDCCKLAIQNHMATIPSHRGGGETNDTFMVDLAVAVGSAWIKVGPTRGERVCKYNRLMEIERKLNSK